LIRRHSEKTECRTLPWRPRVAARREEQEAAGPRPTTVASCLGILHEDTLAVTDDGCENLCPKWNGTPERPAVGVGSNLINRCQSNEYLTLSWTL
jgi:hypothetical protein